MRLSGEPDRETAGLAVAGVGLAAVAFGIVLTLSNPRSELTQRLVNTVAARPHGGPKAPGRGAVARQPHCHAGATHRDVSRFHPAVLSCPSRMLGA